MSDAPEDLSLQPAAPPPAVPPPPPPEREPFWGYTDVALFFGLAFPCLLIELGNRAGARWRSFMSATR